jgi:MFS family permease
LVALSMPARQAFVPELVGDELVFNAMALNSASWNLSRILGPTLAGGIIAVIAGDTTSAFGVGVCTVIATPFTASMRPRASASPETQPRGRAARRHRRGTRVRHMPRAVDLLSLASLARHDQHAAAGIQPRRAHGPDGLLLAMGLRYRRVDAGAGNVPRKGVARRNVYRVGC